MDLPSFFCSIVLCCFFVFTFDPILFSFLCASIVVEILVWLRLEESNRVEKRILYQTTLGHRGCTLNSQQVERIQKSQFDFQGPTENTIPAFQFALSNGANGVELDVQLTKDKELYIFHDLNLSQRLLSQDDLSSLSPSQDFKASPIRFSSVASSALKNLKVSFRSKTCLKSSIPSLQEFFDFLIDHTSKNPHKSSPVVMVELKTGANYKELVSRLIVELEEYQTKRKKRLFKTNNNGDHDQYDNGIVIGSFNPLALYYFRTHSPRSYATLFLVGNSLGDGAPLWWIRYLDPLYHFLCLVVVPFLLRPAIMSFNWKLVERKVDVTTWIKNYGVNLWTVNNNSLKKKYISLGCSVTTDQCFDGEIGEMTEEISN
eukprot:TRINITY_DN3303_c0_g1_i1.p1 TRINITY_DN3303_c0_g1~~TRINITY_DN3303_c0_g1_i1.p1  ORF type:complete len:380 (-),score=81.69 TRINITY_DN3303_c0_g1_i1:239-1357(-)